ncbi:hypothetical protein A3K24_02545 [candidate division Kazan bacterium RIFCSPHIGHO2_01_FULL_44_14]|uniref:Nudix hydrolase domain-containing protein n=1 Tax=candidate division Kazan bacterium RIFCSPLOWO2_01_FULL_45_19 TaxID=1798538 RepID=A0A1F4NQF5_UNCK3|nr:MAG: hypothetical protein A3K51_02545 [candidate division Kazan bacterium RIFCSPLOWO2_01_FULL_45_19]OGB77938.1 MAG: hypothetical protein A3K24_02545 [candidate division Kazan bacterium RIFCSPHIGHO2_01_FULL_44_14]
MKDRDRVAGLIIQDGKLLLVTGYDADYYWTPGGKMDGGEDHEQALRREMKEELGIDISNPRFFTQMEYFNSHSEKQQVSHYYLVDYRGEIKPAKEITGYRFFGAEELPRFTHFVNDDNLLSKLLSEKLVR